jgi:hypothetical protein
MAAGYYMYYRRQIDFSWRQYYTSLYDSLMNNSANDELI